MVDDALLGLMYCRCGRKCQYQGEDRQHHRLEVACVCTAASTQVIAVPELPVQALQHIPSDARCSVRMRCSGSTGEPHLDPSRGVDDQGGRHGSLCALDHRAPPQKAGVQMCNSLNIPAWIRSWRYVANKDGMCGTALVHVGPAQEGCSQDVQGDHACMPHTHVHSSMWWAGSHQDYAQKQPWPLDTLVSMLYSHLAAFDCRSLQQPFHTAEAGGRAGQRLPGRFLHAANAHSDALYSSGHKTVAS